MQPDSAPPPYGIVVHFYKTLSLLEALRITMYFADSYMTAVHQYYPQSIADGYYDGHVSPVVQQQPRAFVPGQTEYAAG